MNCRKPYPIGHPLILTEGFGATDSVHFRYRGLIKCSVLPPDRLLHPLLGAKINGKLVFALCPICAENMLQVSCPHADEERLIVGVWTTFELSKAVSLGYTITEVDEIWHWGEWSENLFAPYIKNFFKVKEEVSAFFPTIYEY